MHQYISKCSGEQPEPTVKRMAPAPEPVDPRYMKRVQENLRAMQQPQMSSSDGVSITINIQPSAGPSAATYPDGYGSQVFIVDDQQVQPQEYISKRTRDILLGAMRQARQ